MRYNALKSRKNGEAPGISISREEFLVWLRGQERKCIYCGVTQETLEKLNLKTAIGLPLKRIGIDRRDNERGYEIDNMQLCCLACNRVKSSVFSHEEMLVLGQSIARVWEKRIEEYDRLHSQDETRISAPGPEPKAGVDAPLSTFRELAAQNPRLLIEMLEEQSHVFASVDNAEFERLLTCEDREVRQRAAIIIGKRSPRRKLLRTPPTPRRKKAKEALTPET